MSEPHTLNWVDPTAFDVTGAPPAPLTPADLAAVSILIDSLPEVRVPITEGQTTLDLTTLPVYATLAPGKHSLTMAVVSTGGTVGDYSTPAATFLVDGKPAAPTAVTVV